MGVGGGRISPPRGPDSPMYRQWVPEGTYARGTYQLPALAIALYLYDYSTTTFGRQHKIISGRTNR